MIKQPSFINPVLIGPTTLAAPRRDRTVQNGTNLALLKKKNEIKLID